MSRRIWRLSQLKICCNCILEGNYKKKDNCSPCIKEKGLCNTELFKEEMKGTGCKECDKNGYVCDKCMKDYPSLPNIC